MDKWNAISATLSKVFRFRSEFPFFLQNVTHLTNPLKYFVQIRKFLNTFPKFSPKFLSGHVETSFESQNSKISLKFRTIFAHNFSKDFPTKSSSGEVACRSQRAKNFFQEIPQRNVFPSKSCFPKKFVGTLRMQF